MGISIAPGKHSRILTMGFRSHGFRRGVVSHCRFPVGWLPAVAKLCKAVAGREQSLSFSPLELTASPMAEVR